MPLKHTHTHTHTHESNVQLPPCVDTFEYTFLLCPIVTVPVLAGTFAFYTLVEGKSLDAPTAFAAIGWINNLQFPLAALTNTITSFVDAGISLRRLRELFSSDSADVSCMAQWTAVLDSAPPHRTGGRGPDSSPSMKDSIQKRVPMTEWLDLEVLCENCMGDNEAHPHATTRAGFALGVSHFSRQIVLKVEGETTLDSAIASTTLPLVELVGASFGWSYREEEDDAPSSGGASRPAASVAKPPAQAVPSLGPVLRDVSVSCPRGTLTLVVGAVGSGKSTFISGLIGDADRLSGTVLVRGSVAFAGQVPWVQNLTVRENVTFSLPFRPSWYNTVMAACCLDRDVAGFKHGDDELIGDSGITLSGGQRQRVALARAVYAESSVVILDDVLSAVDATTGAHIWRHCILGLILQRGGTVVMATHAVSLTDTVWPCPILPQIPDLVLHSSGALCFVARGSSIGRP